MKLGNIIEFRKDIYFEGAVQIDWFYNKTRAAKVAENFVFHGKKYFGIENAEGNQKRIDTVSFVEKIAEKKDENYNPLTLAIADYGTGKSHLAVTLGQLLSGPDYMPETYNKIIENIARIDKEEAEKVRSLCNERDFVLVINGMNDFNLNSEILKAAQKSLKLYGLPDTSLRSLNRALVTAENFFERNFDIFKDKFENYASENDWDLQGEELKKKIKETILYDDTAFNIVNSVYKDINGQDIRWDEGLSASSVLEMLIDEFCGATGQFDRVVILFDEFGRYLEYASGVSSARSGDSALQQIFETAQNAEGQLQVINFIQSDIKTYLQRVDRSKNISRYIGRYDESDKFYLSSNLETVFANLIYRKDKDAFKEYIVEWQNDHEEDWKKAFAYLNKWTITKGLWKNYEFFRKVIVEGIYPMHPLSTFMLTQLSDYLQNRSSLTLVSHYINEYSDKDIRNEAFLVMPYELMRGDLFTEMLSAEQEGRQKSRQCILYDAVLRKYGDKLSEDSLKILQSNLIMRILRFKTKTYDDALEALSFCSGLSIDQINDELQWIINEYGILSFDEHAGCFDFNEESNGAHDYKIIKKRLIANTTIDDSALQNIQVQMLAEVDSSLATNFVVTHNISTADFCFAQEMYSIKYFNEDRVKQCLDEFNKAHDAITPKGKVVWLYINKDTEESYLTRACALTKAFSDKPILIMMLNDEDNRIHDLLVEYKVLNNFSPENIAKYNVHYQGDLDNVKKNLSSEFDSLKKERIQITETGAVKLKGRLTKVLTNVFEQIYKNAIPFHFDGFITKANKVAPKAVQNYFTIIKLLLSGNIDKNIIHSFSKDVRNRIEGLLFANYKMSWKCINNEFEIQPPEEPKVKVLYNAVYNYIVKKQKIPLKALYAKFIKPPFGLNEFSFLLLISVITANNSYCMRFQVGEKTVSVANWANEIILNDKKMDLKKILNSRIIWVDANEIETKYIKIFNMIEKNKNLAEVSHLKNKLHQIREANDLPETLKTRYVLIENILNDGLAYINKWDTELEKVNDEFDKAFDHDDIYCALNALTILKEIPINEIFANYEFSSEYKEKLNSLENTITKHINDNFPDYIKNYTCNDVQSMKTFGNHCKKLEKMLHEFGFLKFEEMARYHRETELEDISKVKERVEFKSNIDQFMNGSKINEYVSYTKVNDYLIEGKSLLKQYAKYKDTLGKKSNKIGVSLQKRVNELNEHLTSVKNEMNAIYDMLYDAETTQDLLSIKSKIHLVLQKGLRTVDEKGFNTILQDINELTSDTLPMNEVDGDRDALNEIRQKLLDKYEEAEYDFSAIDIIDNDYNTQKNKILDQEKKWKDKYLTLGNKTSNDLHLYKDHIRILPSYLSKETLDEVKRLDDEADQLLSQNRINEVIFWFNKLSDEEKALCLSKLQKLI